MLSVWSDLPWWERLGLGLIVTAMGIALCIRSIASGGPSGLFIEDVSRYRLILGFALTGIGFGMLMIGGRSDAEKNGYKF
jgi:hypothetical protein